MSKTWFGLSIWLYPEKDKKFLSLLLTNLKQRFGEQCCIWQNDNESWKIKYPQYLCSADLHGISGDTVHLWRDGQTWWPISGDYSLKDEDDVELILRKTLKQSKKEK